jgi:hypothetical protein
MPGSKVAPLGRPATCERLGQQRAGEVQKVAVPDFGCFMVVGLQCRLSTFTASTPS